MVRYYFHSIFRSIIAFLTTPLYFGRSLKNIPEGSLVLFPCYPNRLYCGLIGLLEYKLPVQKHENASADDGYKAKVSHLQKLWSQIYTRGLNSFKGGSITASEYLKGEATVLAFRDKVIALKGINLFDNIFIDHDVQKILKNQVAEIADFLAKEEAFLDKSGSSIDSSTLEMLNRRLVIIKDCGWRLEKELLLNIEKVGDLLSHFTITTPNFISNQLIREMQKLNLVLNNLDRLEIRGRDSAGISVMVQFPDQGKIEDFEALLKNYHLFREYTKRKSIAGFTHRAIVIKGQGLFFCFKIAKEMGKLGDNVLFLRHAIRKDPILQCALAYQGINSQLIAHTRWASVGDISEMNCHPLDNNTGSCGHMDIQINVVLNGDIDNYQDLRQRLEEEDKIFIPEDVTTDTKIIPLWVEHYMRKDVSLQEAFRLAVSDFKGSHAIALQSSKEPGRIFLAQRGSGQAIFVGIGSDCYVAASEVYGIVEQTPYYIKLDGERQRVAGKKETQGQIFILDNKGGLSGLKAFYYDSHPIKVDQSLIRSAQITTRDIDRQGFPHYYLKEITESPESVKKTIRGKFKVSRKNRDKEVIFNLGEEILPHRIVDALRGGRIRFIYLIGQGTAGVAGEGIAMLIGKYLAGAPITVSATKASELSGFGIDRSMADSLVLAVTQSGTTTDTNKAVDMARSHGAFTMGIVNRRDSDITTKVDGVFYTSDGRDVEMAVASTKAFYSQIVAGSVLGLYMAKILGTRSDAYIASELRELKHLPVLMLNIIENQQALIAASAGGLAIKKRNWSVVGSGPNKVAADEIRIKLSELCYKTLPADVVEDRKHIDLSAEPLIIVCAAGNREIVLGDVIKDTAIFKAHQATVICFATEGEERFDKVADIVFYLPPINERLAPVLNTVVGHLLGYYIAKAINDEADFFRRFKIKLNKRISELSRADKKAPDMFFDTELRLIIQRFIKEVMLRKERGDFDGAVRPSTLCNLVLALRYATGLLPANEMINDIGPVARLGDPLIILTQMIDETVDQLSRPIDAIKHQAKTVTVGTSRIPAALSGKIFDMLDTLGFGLTHLTPQVILSIRTIQPVLEKVNGITVYHVTGLDPFGGPTDKSRISIVKRCGISKHIHSRVEKDHTLRGTKRTVVKNGEVYIGKGLWDDAQIIILPLLGKKENEKYLMVFHISFLSHLPLDMKIKAMGIKYNDVVDMIMEWNIHWDDKLLAGYSPAFLMLYTEDEIAEKIKESITP